MKNRMYKRIDNYNLFCSNIMENEILDRAFNFSLAFSLKAGLSTCKKVGFF